MKFSFEFLYSFGPNHTRKIEIKMILAAFNNIYITGFIAPALFFLTHSHSTLLPYACRRSGERYRLQAMSGRSRAVEREVRGGKLPRAPRQRRGPVIPQNEFFTATGWNQKLINQILIFLNCATTFRRQSSSYSVIATYQLSVITSVVCTKSCQCYSKRQKLLLWEGH